MLVIVIVLAVLQLTLALHVRNTLIDSAAEGARHAALLGSDPGEGVGRARELITMSLSPRYADDVTATTITRGGMELVEVTVAAPLPVLGLLGPGGTVRVSGHAVVEGQFTAGPP